MNIFSTFSGIGGLELDERWGWPWMAAVVRAVRPSYVVVENVAALVRDRDAFGWMLGDLAADGFDAEWAVLSAPEFGAPQAARERLYLVAYSSSVDGGTRDRLGASGIGGSPLTAGGPAASEHIGRLIVAHHLGVAA